MLTEQLTIKLAESLSLLMGVEFTFSIKKVSSRKLHYTHCIVIFSKLALPVTFSIDNIMVFFAMNKAIPYSEK